MTLHFTPDYINRRIEHAGATLRCLRVKHPSTLMAQGRVEIVREVIEDAAPGASARSYPMPAPRDVALMDEALSWILLIPNTVRRRLVGLRSQFDPLRERHVFSWRECGTVINTSHVSAKSWHAQSIALLTTALAGAQVISPAGCNVLPRHIDLNWAVTDAA